MTIYDDIKLEKLEHLLIWLCEERSTHPSEELEKLIQRVEQQVTFMKLPEDVLKKYELTG